MQILSSILESRRTIDIDQRWPSLIRNAKHRISKQSTVFFLIVKHAFIRLLVSFFFATINLFYLDVKLMKGIWIRIHPTYDTMMIDQQVASVIPIFRSKSEVFMRLRWSTSEVQKCRTSFADFTDVLPIFYWYFINALSIPNRCFTSTSKCSSHTRPFLLMMYSKSSIPTLISTMHKGVHT